MRAENPLSAWVESPEPLVRELWCCFAPGDALQREADGALVAFLRDIEAALDACVLAAANSVCRPIGLVETQAPLDAYSGPAPRSSTRPPGTSSSKGYARIRFAPSGCSSRSPNVWSPSPRGPSRETWRISQPGLRRWVLGRPPRPPNGRWPRGCRTTSSSQPVCGSSSAGRTWPTAWCTDRSEAASTAAHRWTPARGQGSEDRTRRCALLPLNH